MADQNAPWYSIDNCAEIDTPALAIYPERVKKNIGTAVGMVRDVSLLRPHVKTHKSADAARLQLDAGITKFKCATIAEAEMLATAGAPDVLLAYQPVGPKILRLLALVQAFPRTAFSCLIDDRAAATAIAAVFASHDLTLNVCLDLNVGMNRTGIRPDAAAARLYRDCRALEGIHPAGLHAYDGHLQGNDPAALAQECGLAFAPVRALQHDLRDDIHGKPVIIAGGSPTFPIHAHSGDVECSPGTFIYWDKNYELQLTGQTFLPAALVLSRVVSRPSGTTLCLDAGYKAVASEKDLHHRLYFLNAPNAVVVSQSEEHLVIDTGGSPAFAIGDVLYGIPYHVCPTCALYDRAVTVREQQADGCWATTARNRTITI